MNMHTALATVAAFAVGGVWYGPLFGKAWQAELAMTPAQWAAASKVRLFATSLVCEAIIALLLRFALGFVFHSAAGTLLIALIIALGFVVPTMVMNHNFALKSGKLMAIDAGHWIAVFLTIGAVLAAFGT